MQQIVVKHFICQGEGTKVVLVFCLFFFVLVFFVLLMSTTILSNHKPYIIVWVPKFFRKPHLFAP